MADLVQPHLTKIKENGKGGGILKGLLKVFFKIGKIFYLL